jgi:hypothetical protein
MGESDRKDEAHRARTAEPRRERPQPFDQGHSGVRSSLIVVLVLMTWAVLFQPDALPADTVPVRHTEGLMHGFLVLQTLDGKPIADGQMTQDAHGDRVTDHLIFRFRDGSIYEDTTVFSQRQTFRLMSDHLIQRGPSSIVRWTPWSTRPLAK